jgi:phosphoribosylaminoimidazole-succinocarboxamide synthase
VTDRISAFDLKMKTPIPDKGQVLNRLAAYWFERTRDIIGNHVSALIDPNLTLVREAKPVRVEMIVRGYLAGSMWRGYQQGLRVFSGVTVPEGLTQNARLPSPIVTPTTKEESDREITPDGIVREGLATHGMYQRMAEASPRLYQRASEILEAKGLLLADTKYEFGLIDGELILIDEIHTPDSSRFWEQKRWQEAPERAEPLDKEFVRQWLMANRDAAGNYQRSLPPDVIDETARRYRDIFTRITGETIETPDDIHHRVYRSLVRRGLVKEGFVAICMGSPSDLPHCRKIAEVIERYGVRVELRVVSAHKNGERVVELARRYNAAIEPGAVIAVAGESNGLGGALAANLSLPVINCPPFSDKTDLLINLNSSLMLPSRTPALTAVRPENAALGALRALNLRSLRGRFDEDIAQMKAALDQADEEIRGATT